MNEVKSADSIRSGLLSSHYYLTTEYPVGGSAQGRHPAPIDVSGAHNQEEALGAGSSQGPLWSTLAQIEGAGPTVEQTPDPRRSSLERTWNWVRRNKAIVAAGMISVAGIVANPMEASMDALDARTAGEVLLSVSAAEVAWISGAVLALGAAGMQLPRTRNPLKFPGILRDEFKKLSKENVKENRAAFNTGITINTAAAVLQAAVPTVAIFANLPPAFWGVTSFCALDLWATFVIRRKILSKVR